MDLATVGHVSSMIDAMTWSLKSAGLAFCWAAAAAEVIVGKLLLMATVVTGGEEVELTCFPASDLAAMGL